MKLGLNLLEYLCQEKQAGIERNGKANEDVNEVHS